MIWKAGQTSVIASKQSRKMRCACGAMIMAFFGLIAVAWVPALAGQSPRSIVPIKGWKLDGKRPDFSRK